VIDHFANGGKVYAKATMRFKPKDSFDKFYYAIFKRHFPEGG